MRLSNKSSRQCVGQRQPRAAHVPLLPSPWRRSVNLYMIWETPHREVVKQVLTPLRGSNATTRSSTRLKGKSLAGPSLQVAPTVNGVFCDAGVNVEKVVSLRILQSASLSFALSVIMGNQRVVPALAGGPTAQIG